MGKNILVLTGSPRKNGNTEKLADAFIKGAKGAGHTVIKIRTADKNIKGCIDCKTCFSKGTPCSFNDDFNTEIAPNLEQADILALVTPMYWFSFPSQIKPAIDKIYSYLIGNKLLKIKETALLVCGGDKDETYYEGLVSSYKLISRFMNWEDRGTVIVKGLHDKDEILATDGLERAKEFGNNI